MSPSVLTVKKLARLCLGFLCVYLCSSAPAYAEPLPLTPVQITDLIKTHGATAAINQLDQGGQLDDVMDKIGAGKAEWIALAPEIAKGGDAGASEELSISLASALPISPDNVLGVLTTDADSALSPNAVCSAPFTEDTVQDIPAYIKKASAAVQTVKDVSLKDLQTSCLAELYKAATMPTDNP